jgi:hypothetical protein
MAQNYHISQLGIHDPTRSLSDVFERQCAIEARDGRSLQTSGLVPGWQKPGSAKEVMFITIEDETGILLVAGFLMGAFGRTMIRVYRMLIPKDRPRTMPKD